MFALVPTPLSLSLLGTAMRLHLTRRPLRPHCRSMSVFDRHPDPPAHTSATLRAAHFRTASSRPLGSAWPASWALGACHVLAKTYTTTRSTPEEVGDGVESLKVLVKGREVGIPWVWLRDHCRCSTCYYTDTFQKNVDNISLDKVVLVQSGVDGDVLSVQWQDGHISKYSVQWLGENFCTAGVQAERFLWDGPRMRNEPLPVTPFDLHMKTEDGLKNTLSNIIKYGFCIVDGAPVSAEGTEMVTKSISFPLQTLYGQVCTMVSGKMTHSDIAYTSLPLGAHTDTTYFTTPAGIQVFHCLQHDGEGGSTLLVDGFCAAEELCRSDPPAFECLTRTPVPHEFISKGSHYHFYSVGTVLSTDVMSDQLRHIRFNPYDRAALRTVAVDDIAQFYSSYEALSRIIRSPGSEFWVKLNPGMVLLVDNWRIMHGRSSFTGRRVLCSFYLPRDDWISRARVLGLMAS